MDHNDEMKRIEGAPEVKEIPQDFDTAAVAGRKPRRKVAASDAVASTAISDVKWGILASVIVLALVVGVYLLSGVRTRSLQGDESTDPTATLTASVMEENAVISEPGMVAVSNAGEATVSDEVIATVAVQAPDAVYLFPLSGSDVIDSEVLDQVAATAVGNDADVIVIAYTDESGSAEYNQALSQQRADAVAHYLEEHGVAHNHIVVRGLGETHRFDSNSLDRRAEVHLI